MPSADQDPIESPHSTMRGGSGVVLIAGSTGSALRAVRPPNLHITPVVWRDLVSVLAQRKLEIQEKGPMPQSKISPIIKIFQVLTFLNLES
jgi:hypothetical protein